MTILDGILQSADTGLANTDYTFVDADTLVKPDGTKFRIQGIDAPEVEKFVQGKYREGTAGGEVATETLRKLANDYNFTNVKPVLDENGEPAIDPFGRHIVDLVDDSGQSFKSKILESGILGTTRYTTDIDRVTSELGDLRREQDALRGVEGNTDWDQARIKLETAMQAEGFQQYGFRQTALDEVQLATAKSYGLGHLYASDNVQVRDYGRDFENNSNNPLSDAWDTGLIGVQESMYGIVNLLGVETGYDALANIGEAGVERARTRIGDRGQILTDYKDVQGFGDAVEYLTNNAVLSLPYMGITAAAAVAGPAFLLAPAAVYAGQTWNEMEGENKNAAVAVGAGVVQAAFDRLGIGLIFKGAGKGPKDMIKAGIKKLTDDGMTEEAARLTIMNATRAEMASFAGDAAKVAADQLKAKALFKSVASRTLAGTAGEAATETLQETTAYLAAHHTGAGFDWNDLTERQLQAFIAGGTLGGAFGTVGGAIDAGAWADVAVRQAPAEAKRLSLAGKFAEEEKAKFGRVSSIQENTAAARKRAADAGPTGAVSIEERIDAHRKSRKDKDLSEKVIDAFHSAPALWRGATRYIFTPELLEKSRSARIMADMFGGQLQRTFSGSNFENTKHHIVSTYRNLVPMPKTFWNSQGIRSRKGAAEASAQLYRGIDHFLTQVLILT